MNASVNPSFDTWTSIFLFAAIQGFFVAMIILFKNRPIKAERILLSAIVFLFSLTLFQYVMFWTRYQFSFPHIINISGGFTFLYGPLFFYYFRKTFEDYKFKPVDLLSLIPFLVYVIAHSRFYFASAENKLNMIFSGGAGYRFPYWVWLSIAFMIGYAVLILKQYNEASKANKEIRTWFIWLNVFYIGFFTSFASYFILVLFPFFNKQFDYMISFSMSFFIYFLAWFGYLQPKVFAGFSVKEIIKEGRYAASGLTDNDMMQIINRLNFFMDREKLYKDFELNLEKLSNKTGAPKHHISQSLNIKLGLNYFDYLNKFRIKEASLLLQNTSKKEMNIMQVALESGFNNKATFNNAFKKIMGVTPTEYRKQITADDENSVVRFPYI